MPEYTQTHQELLADGEYPFKVKNAVLSESNNKNPMIELTLQIKDAGVVYDNLVFTEKAFWKIDQFRLATGEKINTTAKVRFEAQDCIGRIGWCELFTDEFQGQYRNKIANYVTTPDPSRAAESYPVGGNSAALSAVGATTAARPARTNEFGEPDDIPF